MPDEELTEENIEASPLDIFKALDFSSRKRLSDELFIKLRDAILSGALPSGYVFPNENELCKKLDIGRSSLREAYASLETMNLIKRTKNGTFVNGAADTKNSMNFDIIAQYTDPANIMEYRRIIEVGIAACAAQKATSTDVEALLAIVRKMEKHSASYAALTVYDFEFHSTLAKITGNELLQIALSSIQLSYEKFVFMAFQKNLFFKSVKDHMELIEALRQNDPNKAAQIMREHLEHIDLAFNESKP
jgi:GntR family transcriptional repressor for pyruvate dehydrogenase complex